ncbi:sigma-54-dependent transcriptional regulator [Frateuria defendens]|uniref:sigma-54-dependent transcriptional regulator n=1 Tax=Frateuria defendens TaxID=2219559 RepID=UPI00137920EA|nr:sigma-54 dependent transcriptional regulator [Frateuria defendens]
MRRAIPTVLLVDDDQDFLNSASAYARLRGCEVSVASTLKDAARLVSEARLPDLMLLDIGLPDGNGLDLLERMPADSRSRVVVVTGNPSVDTALHAMRHDIMDYVVKPVEQRRLDALLERASVHASARLDVPGEPESCGGLLGNTPAMRKLFRMIRRVAPLENTVLLFGESGTGKELAARAIHDLSGRPGAFVAVNCGAVAPELLGSQLFGHERGSFTGAVRDHAGYFEQAQHGTLFLDECTEMPPSLQTYLLRVLESKNVTRLGSSARRTLDVRVVAACNRNPAEAVRDGALRADLYYRLSDFPLLMPPLRERVADIPLLAERFLAQLNAQYRTAHTLSAASMERLLAHGWHGNVRELQHVINRAYVLAENGMLEAMPAHPPGWAAGDSAILVGQTLEEIEKRAILTALDRYNNDKTRAAKALGISVKTIYNKLTRYREGTGPGQT